MQTSIVSLHQQLLNKEISSVELTKHYLNAIAKSDLNAFIHVDEAYAIRQAMNADDAIKQNKATPLTGIPMAHKDIFTTQSLPTTCGSKMLANYRSPYDAFVVSKLLQAGAVILGKTNMDEFAMGSTNESSYFGAVSNPWEKTHTAGGSSGGSAAAVAGGLVPFATGSDTGGSIRQPAAFCGISGIKPTYGLVSRFGMIAYASSLDQGGPLARSVEDVACVLQHMVGFDQRDSTSIDRAPVDYLPTLSQPLKPIKIGIPRALLSNDLAEPILQALMQALDVFKELAFEIVEVDFALSSFWVPCYYIIACAEASSNLSRYDGLRFGHQASNALDLMDLITRSRAEGFGQEVKRRILAGTFVLSSGYYEAYYYKAQQVRALIQKEMLQTLEEVDVIVMPTAPTTATTLGEKLPPVQSYLADIYTVVANLTGLPALSIPIGFDKGLPIGMQLMAKPFAEALLLQMGYTYQQKTVWHQQRPKDV